MNDESKSNRATDLAKNIVENIMSPQKDNSIETTHNISPLKNNTLIIQHQNRNVIESLDESEPVVQSLSGKLEKASGKSNNNKSVNNETKSASQVNVGGECSTYSAADTNYTSIVDPNDHGKGNCIDGVLISIGSQILKHGTLKIVSGGNDPHILINWDSNDRNYLKLALDTDSSDLHNAFYYCVHNGEKGNNLIAFRVDPTKENALLTAYADVYTQPSSNKSSSTKEKDKKKKGKPKGKYVCCEIWEPTIFNTAYHAMKKMRGYAKDCKSGMVQMKSRLN